VTEIAIDDDAVAERVQLDDESWVDVTRGRTRLSRAAHAWHATVT